ncbi:ATP-binding protein [Paracoccus sp. (in: a-proteobacteria)]|uniref:ATP-binding protein n=1 Tax=Paracoccus sp. TaxID=267 RepID=UPI00289966CF|nr:ATP-binding protein [Paracoccus sp. (in: a-proteobacteria)]
MVDVTLGPQGLRPEVCASDPIHAVDPRPSREDVSAFSDWLLRRYFISAWDNHFLARLEMVLKRDGEGNLLPEGKEFRSERRGVCITALSQHGKTTMVWQVLKRLFNDSFTESKCGERIAYCRLRGEASVKSICQDLCRSTGYNTFPVKMTRPEASDLAVHRLRLAGITMVVIDEVHNMSDSKDVINRFLKTLAQDRGGVCVILVGTPKFREFIYNDPAHLELAERYLDLPLMPFARAETIDLIHAALREVTKDAGMRLAASIRKDLYFADRIYDGLHGSFGRCMFLTVNAVIRAFEQGGDTVEAEDFRKVFDLKYLHFNAQNPFVPREWAPAIHEAAVEEGDRSSVFFDVDLVPPAPKKKRGRPRKSTGAAA